MSNSDAREGSPQNPIDHDFNVENLENAEKSAEEANDEEVVEDVVDDEPSEPEPVDGGFNPSYGG